MSQRPDFFACLAVLRMAALIFVVVMVIATHVLGAAWVYFLTGVVFIACGYGIVLDSRVSHREPYWRFLARTFGAFCLIVGIVYCICVFVDASAFAAWLGNGITLVGMQFYGVLAVFSVLLSLVLGFVGDD